MDELLLRHLRGQTTEEEDRVVDGWRGRRPGAERVLAELGRLIEVGRAVDAVVDPGDPPVAEEVVSRARTGGRRSPARRRSSRVRLVHYGGWAVAAAVAGLALRNALADPASFADAFGGKGASQEFITASGETAMVRLRDGSVVRLGPGSRLVTAAGAGGSESRSPSPDLRQVALEGEAFFSVATNSGRPFRVLTAAGTARALGTRFHLAAKAEELAVVVVEGRIALTGPDREVEVGAGEAARLVRGVPGPVTGAPPIGSVAGWMRGFLIFQETPLTVATKEIGERYGVEVEVADAAILERTLTMWFSSESLDEVMTVVCGAVDASCGLEEGVVRIRARGTGAES